MWWPELIAARRVAIRLACVAAASAMVAGCFQPLYGDHSFSSTPGVATALSSVDVTQIVARQGTPEARVAVEIRNQLLFNLTGGANAAPPAYRLVVRMSSTRQSVIVDVTSGRPDVEDYGINATYQLQELKTGKQVLNSATFATVSYDTPGQQQRFAEARGLRDSENRAAKLIADNIKARLASFFVAGT
jgi:LPS-assembly lipoprotein